MRAPSEAVLPTVRANHPRPAQPGQDGRGLGVEAELAAPERGVERALADGEAEQLEQQPAEPPVADLVGEAQVHRQRDDVRAERRARLQPFRQRRQGGAAAAAAMPSVALHPGHHRRDRRQVHLVEAGGERLAGLGQRRLAVRAARRAGGDGLVLRLRQQAPAALAAETALARTGAVRPVIAAGLLAPGRRQAGVVGRLRRHAGLGFQFRHPRRQGRNLCRQRPHLRPQRSDQRVLLSRRSGSQVGEPLHRPLESRPAWSRQALRDHPTYLPHPGRG